MAVISINSLYWNNYEYTTKRYIAALLLGILVVLDLKLFVKKRYIVINCLVLLLGASIIYASWINRNLSSSSLVTSVFYAIQILDGFLYTEYLESKNKYRTGITVLLFLKLFYCVLTDIYMIVDLRTKTYAWGTEVFYLIGNKFNVTYLHLLAMTLIAQLNEEKLKYKKNKLVLMGLWCFIIAIYTECTTALIGLIIMVVFIFKKEELRHYITSPQKIVATFFVCDTVLVFFSQILKWTPIRFVIETILHESVDLTNRVYIYERSFAMLFAKPWFGYGYDNNIAQSRIFTQANNTQNGIMDCIVSYGVIGLILTVAIIAVAVYKSKRKNTYFLLVLMLTYIVLSSVEITIRGVFFAILALAMCGENIGKPKNGGRE